jgi:hypothetical protein
MEKVKDNKFLNVISKLLFGFLAFCLSFLGYILWFALKKHYPEQAKSCLVGSTIGSVMVIFSVAFAFLIPDNPEVSTEELSIAKANESEEVILTNTDNVETFLDEPDLETEETEQGSIFGKLAGIIVICIIIYVIAFIFAKKTSCIIVYGWKDFFLLVCPFLLIILFFIYNISYGSDHEKAIYTDNIAAIIILLLPVIATSVVSVISNLRHSNMPQSLLFIVVSIIGKIAIIVLMAVILILLLGLLGGYQGKRGVKDKRYKSGYRPGKNNAWAVAILLMIWGFIATIFIKSIANGIVKTSDDIDGNKDSFEYTICSR